MNLLAMSARVKHSTASESRSFALRLIRQLAGRSPVSLAYALRPGSNIAVRRHESPVPKRPVNSVLVATRPGCGRTRMRRNPPENCIATRLLLQSCQQELQRVLCRSGTFRLASRRGPSAEFQQGRGRVSLRRFLGKRRVQLSCWLSGHGAHPLAKVVRPSSFTGPCRILPTRARTCGQRAHAAAPSQLQQSSPRVCT